MKKKIRELKRSFWSYVSRIQFVIIVSFFSVMMCATVAVILYTQTKFSGEMRGVIDAHLDLSVQDQFARVQRLFSRIQGIAQASGWGRLNRARLLDQKQGITSQFIGSLHSYSYIKKLNITLKDGSYFSASKLRDSRQYVFSPDKKLPDKTKFRVVFLEYRDGKWHKRCAYYDQEGRHLDSEEKSFEARGAVGTNADTAQQSPLMTTVFDMRGMQWYQAVQKTKEFCWSEVYRHLGGGDIRLTAAHQIKDDQGGFLGVASADIRISDLSDFLKRGSGGVIAATFLFNNRGECFGYPKASAVATVTEEGVALKNVSHISDFQIGKVFQKYETEQKEGLAGDEAFYARPGGGIYFLKFPKTFAEKWTFGVVIQSHTLLAPIQKLYQHSLVFYILTLILSTILLILVSKRIAFPIEAVAYELRRIQNLEFDFKLKIKSRFYEIGQMIQVLKGVVNGLHSFGKFVPKSLVRQLVKTGQKIDLGGEKKRLTVFFSDIAGFTAISEKTNPEELLFHLSDYFEEMTSVIMKNHGTLDKYVGDAIVAFWGAPYADEQQSYRACVTALACADRLEILGKKWIQEGKAPLYTRFGINTGPMLVGNMGSSDRLQYTVLGDDVNLGSRLEQLCKIYGTRILVGQATYEEVRDFFIFRPVDLVAVRGKEKGVQIYELLAERQKDLCALDLGSHFDLAYHTTSAYRLYLAQKWDLAYEAYAHISQKYPQDYLSRFFMNRCETFSQTPPKEGWDSITKMGKKSPDAGVGFEPTTSRL